MHACVCLMHMAYEAQQVDSNSRQDVKAFEDIQAGWILEKYPKKRLFVQEKSRDEMI